MNEKETKQGEYDRERPSQEVYNPYLPEWEYVPDGEPHVFGNRVYVYGSHDESDGKTYCTRDYVCWSAPVDNLADWKYEGISFRRTQDPGNPTGEKYLFAPDVAKGPDGRYYLYYFLSDIKGIGVAVSENPEGPFQYLSYVCNPDGTLLGGTMPFDPGILSNESGNWLYYGFCMENASGGIPYEPQKGGYCVRLENDMVTTCSEPVEVIPGTEKAKGSAFENHAFLEASSIRQIGNRFYLVYSSQQGHELCYAVSPYPDRGFEYGGIIISNADVGFRGNMEPQNFMANNHGGMVCIKGQWYIFYHRHSHKLQYSRQGCAEKIQFLEDGSIPQVETTSCGLNEGPLQAGKRHPMYIICGLRGPEGVLHLSRSVQRRENDPYLWMDKNMGKRGKMYLTNFRNGAWCCVKYLYFGGTERIAALEIRGEARGILRIHMCDKGETQWTLLGECAVEEGDSWHWTTGNIAGCQGEKVVSFSFLGTGSVDILSFQFKD